MGQGDAEVVILPDTRFTVRGWYRCDDVIGLGQVCGCECVRGCMVFVVVVCVCVWRGAVVSVGGWEQFG